MSRPVSLKEVIQTVSGLFSLSADRQCPDNSMWKGNAESRGLAELRTEALDFSKEKLILVALNSRENKTINGKISGVC